MIDANQRWDVEEAINWVTQLKEFKPLWIEEPTSPDDVLGHATIAKVMQFKLHNCPAEYKSTVHIVGAETTWNRSSNRRNVPEPSDFQAAFTSQCDFLLSNWLLQTWRCKWESRCLLHGEEIRRYCFLICINTPFIFCTHKFTAIFVLTVPVCPHAGGVGLCEMVQHLQIWDYISLTGDKQNRMIEWIDHLHEHFTAPPKVVRGHYVAPKVRNTRNWLEYITETQWKNLIHVMLHRNQGMEPNLKSDQLKCTNFQTENTGVPPHHHNRYLKALENYSGLDGLLESTGRMTSLLRRSFTYSGWRINQI